jgi:hypothetical protein
VIAVLFKNMRADQSQSKNQERKGKLSMTNNPEPTPTIINLRPRHEFVQSIMTQLRNNVAGIFAIGRLLIEAKDELPHGEFGWMIHKELPFGARMAQMYMKIAANRVLSNANHISHLPASVSTLYEFTKLPDELLANLFRRGKITPDVERQYVEHFVKEWKRDQLDWLNLESHLLWLVDFTLSYPEPNRPLAKRIVSPTDDGFTTANLLTLKEWFAQLHAAHLAWEQERKQLLAQDEAMVQRHHELIMARVEHNPQVAVIDDDDDAVEDDAAVVDDEDAAAVVDDDSDVDYSHPKPESADGE